MVSPKIFCMPEVGLNAFKIKKSNSIFQWFEYQIHNLTANVFLCANRGID